jgi:hypothetical protein
VQHHLVAEKFRNAAEKQNQSDYYLAKRLPDQLVDPAVVP